MCSNCTADQRLCLPYRDSTIAFMLLSKISRFYFFSVTVQADLCLTKTETQIVGLPQAAQILCSLIPTELSVIKWSLK